MPAERCPFDLPLEVEEFLREYPGLAGCIEAAVECGMIHALSRTANLLSKARSYYDELSPEPVPMTLELRPLMAQGASLGLRLEELTLREWMLHLAARRAGRPTSNPQPF